MNWNHGVVGSVRQGLVRLAIYTQGHNGTLYVFRDGKSTMLFNVKLLNLFFHLFFVICLSSTLPLTVSSFLMSVM